MLCFQVVVGQQAAVFAGKPRPHRFRFLTDIEDTMSFYSLSCFGNGSRQSTQSERKHRSTSTQAYECTVWV